MTLKEKLALLRRELYRDKGRRAGRVRRPPPKVTLPKLNIGEPTNAQG